MAADPLGTVVSNPTQPRTAMLTDAFPFLLPEYVGGGLPATLRSLADDLDRVRAGTAPHAEDLAHAPLIVDWRTVLSPLGLRLIGFVTGHPLLGNCPAMTSQLWAADPDGRWIRTLTRFYRLGEASCITGSDEPGNSSEIEGVL